MSFSATVDKVINDDCSTSNTMQIALQVLKERCSTLQKRVLSLEDENSRLKVEHVSLSDVPIKEKDLLSKIVDLTKQKSQLTQYVLMMTCENKKLWEYISKNSCSTISQGEKVHAKNDGGSQPKTTGLLRSETFIQSAPNTKQLSKTIDDHYNDSSLEEISLKLINSFLQEKSELVDQYEQMIDLQSVEDKVLNVSSIGLNFIGDIQSDVSVEVKQHIDKMIDLKKDIKQQHCDLEGLLVTLQGIKLGQLCKKCDSGKKNEGNIMKQCQLNKSETYTEMELLDSLTKWATPENSTSYQDNTCDQMSLSQVYSKKDDSSNRLPTENLQSDKKVTMLKFPKQDEYKMCPMCGMYFQTLDIETLTQHVQDHFTREDDEADSIVDNFELVINSIGNGYN